MTMDGYRHGVDRWDALQHVSVRDSGGPVRVEYDENAEPVEHRYVGFALPGNVDQLLQERNERHLSAMREAPKTWWSDVQANEEHIIRGEE